MGTFKGVPRFKLIDGYLRRVLQEHCDTLLLSDAMVAQHVETFATEKAVQFPAICAKDLSTNKGADCLRTALKQLLSLYAWVVLSHPAMQLDAQMVGSIAPFDPSLHAPFDEAVKRGSPCMTIIPALCFANGEIKVKSKVLPA